MNNHNVIMKKTCCILFVSMFFAGTLFAGNPLYRYRVMLADKQETTYSLSKPQEFLSQKALERRERQGLAVDSTDLPVPSAYLSRLEAEGVKVVGTSRWNNTALVETADTARMERVEALPFVTGVLKVWTSPDSIPPRDANRKKQVNPFRQEFKDYYGPAQNQVEMIEADKLHQAGFRGQGMTVAVIDGGFLNADAIPLLQNVKIEGTRNFVHPGWDVYAELDHGMSVLSCMATNHPYTLVGTAPEASYWLFCSEDPDCECLAEEDYWAQAVEYADSVGVDVVNTSLGYYAFDDRSRNYRYRDLDGRTSLMTRSASMAADKGMIVVCSAGNSGDKQWKKITPPGDAENVITVGAVNKYGVLAPFSSVGNTADGRVKPDVVAVGLGSDVMGTDGNLRHANGTSFSSPIMCGMVACLWQACPELTAKEIIELVRRSGDRAVFPDNIYGYGIPDLWKAYQSTVNTRR